MPYYCNQGFFSLFFNALLLNHGLVWFQEPSFFYIPKCPTIDNKAIYDKYKCPTTESRFQQVFLHNEMPYYSY